MVENTKLSEQLEPPAGTKLHLDNLVPVHGSKPLFE